MRQLLFRVLRRASWSSLPTPTVNVSCDAFSTSPPRRQQQTASLRHRWPSLQCQTHSAAPTFLCRTALSSRRYLIYIQLYSSTLTAIITESSLTKKQLQWTASIRPSLKTWQSILSETVNLLKNLHFLFATTSEGIWQPNICLHISTSSWERVEKIFLEVLFKTKSMAYSVSAFPLPYSRMSQYRQCLMVLLPYWHSVLPYPTPNATKT